MESQEEVGVARKPETVRVQTVLALSGIAAPVLFAIVVVVLAALWPGYSHLHGTFSRLGSVGAPNAALFNAAGVVVSALLVAFAVGLHRGLGGGRGSWVGPTLLALGAVGLAGAAVFPADFEDPQSFTALLHRITALIGGLALIAATFFLFLRLRRTDAWRDLASYSLATGGAAVAVGVVLQVLGGEPAPFVGAVQRLAFGVLFLWVFILAVRLLRLSLSLASDRARESPSAREPPHRL